MKIYGVSVDSVESHSAFSQKHGFPFPLLADTHEKVCEAFGVNVKDKKYPERVTFIIDKHGRIAKVYPKVNPRDHVKELLAALGHPHHNSHGQH